MKGNWLIQRNEKGDKNTLNIFWNNFYVEIFMASVELYSNANFVSTHEECEKNEITQTFWLWNIANYVSCLGEKAGLVIYLFKW